MVIGKRVLYSGHVQGVGFRWTAQQLTQGLALAGFVRNLPNGQVELVVEGEPATIDLYLKRIATRMTDNITEADVEEREATNLEGFSVRT